MSGDAYNNNVWKAIDTNADGDIDYFYVTEYDYAHIEDEDTHKKYGDYVVAYDLNSDDALEFNDEYRLYIEDCIISENELVEGNIVKYTWSLDDGQYVFEVLPLAEEVEYTARDAKKGIYELGGEDYMIADEAENGILTNVLKSGNLGESVDFICDDDLVVWAALTDSNFVEIADVNAQLVLVLDAWSEYSSGKIRNQQAIEYMTIDGETHIAAYQDDDDGVVFDDLLVLSDVQDTTKRDDDESDWLGKDEENTYAIEGRLFILHEGTKSRVWLEELNNVGKNPNEQLDASDNLLDEFDEVKYGKLDATGSTVKLGSAKLAEESTFFYGYFDSYGEAVYGVIATEELSGEDDDAYAQVLTLENERGTRTTVVAGYIFTPDMKDEVDDGYLFVDEILRQTSDDYERANVTFMDGETGEINIAKLTGELIESALYTYSYNVADDDYDLVLVEVKDTDNEIIDLDDDYVIFEEAVVDGLYELELGDEIDDVANITIAVTRDQNMDDVDNEFNFYEYEVTSYGFVDLDDVTLEMIIDNEEFSGDLQFSDFVYDAENDVLYVITWVCMDRYTGENLADSPLALMD